MQTMAIDLVNSRPPRLECSCKPLREWMGAVLIGRFLARYWRKHFFPPLSDSLSLSLSRCETEREKLLNPNISEFWCSFHKLEGNRVKKAVASQISPRWRKTLRFTDSFSRKLKCEMEHGRDFGCKFWEQFYYYHKPCSKRIKLASKIPNSERIAMNVPKVLKLSG